jgi:glutamate/tyrosine decarboxylase-like PLP-dependent enzyme
LDSTSISSAQSNNSVDLALPGGRSVGSHFNVLDHELGHIRHNRNPEHLMQFASLITDFHNQQLPHDLADKDKILDHVKKALNTPDVNNWENENRFNATSLCGDNMHPHLKKVVESTATSEYGGTSLTESFAEYHKNYVNGASHPFIQHVGDTLGWDKPA